MDTINYYSNSVIGLEEIEAIAKSAGYRTSYRELPPVEGKDLLIFFGDDFHRRWEWTVYEADDLGIEPKIIEKIKALQPATILLMNYRGAYLPEAASFLKLVLQQYSGLIDCKGDADVMYAVEDIEGIVAGCP